VERSVPRQERWIVLVAAVGFLTVAGAAYSWSLYTRPLMAFFGWSSVEVLAPHSAAGGVAVDLPPTADPGLHQETFRFGQNKLVDQLLRGLLGHWASEMETRI